MRVLSRAKARRSLAIKPLYPANCGGLQPRARWDVRDQDTETSDETPHAIEPMLDLGIEDASPHGKRGRALSIA